MTINRKGIVLAGGTGSRLFPITRAVSKQLLPVYDKPMIYYPLSVLMLAGIREIMVITTPKDLEQYKCLLGDGSEWGIEIVYETQPSPDGLAQALLIAERWLDGSPSALILGDNILFENQLQALLRSADQGEGASIFACAVQDPERYGIINFDDNDHPTELEEKPVNPKSEWAIIGLYFYDSDAPMLAKKIKPSARGELEITCLNNMYLRSGKLNAYKLGRGCIWMDAGLPESLLGASELVKSIQERTGKLIGSPHEVAFLKGFIDADGLKKSSTYLSKTSQGKYLQSLSTKYKSHEDHSVV